MHLNAARNTMPTRKHALIVDGHPLVCDALCSAVAAFYPEYAIHGAYSAREAREMLRSQVKEHRWALVLCDLNLPDADGIELIREVRGQLKAPIVVVTGRDDPLTAHASQQSGASGFVSKGAKLDTLREALTVVLAGRPYFQRSFTSDDVSLMNITARQKQILDRMLSGLSNKAIAQDLALSDGTVRNMVSSLFDKFNVEERTKISLIAKVSAMGYKPPSKKT